MKKFLLIASVAAMAIAVPAQAEREGRGERGQRADRAQQNEQRAERRASKSKQQASDRGAARQQQASDRRSAKQQQISDRRSAQKQQVSDRRSASQQQMSERRSRAQQQASERRPVRQQAERRARNEQAVSDRRSARQQAVSDRRSRSQQVDSDRRARAQQIASDRKSRAQQMTSDRKSRLQQVQSERRSRIDQAQSDRRSRFQQLDSDRRSALQQARSDRRSRFQQIESDRRAAFDGDDRQWRQQAWALRTERLRTMAERRDKLRDRQRAFIRFGDDDDDDRRTFFRVGQRVDRNWWYDDYVPYRYRINYDDDDRYYYRYDGDYLYRLRDNDNVVLSLFPLLGGAYSVGNQLPFYQSSYYNVPMGYNSLYYDTPNSYYRYGDSAIYQVNPTTQLIAGIVALLTGQNLGIGQQLPMGYDVYNVPYAYRSNYYDTNDMWYRYDDGYIYGVDPRTRLIQSQYPVYGGYTVGQAWPSYAGYDYGVPNYYDDLSYDQPNYDYRFASGGIYQVDPATQLVTALVALVTGQNFAAGQPLPAGYDAYNVPFAYRDNYYDNDDNWYRYADGRIYEVDPSTRLIRRVIMV